MAQAGHPAPRADIAAATHGFVADSGTHARSSYLDYEHRMMADGLAELGRPAPPRADPGGMVFAGSPNEIADRLLHLHGPLGHTRHILQMDAGGLPHRDFPHGIELLGTKVLPQIRAELAKPWLLVLHSSHGSWWARRTSDNVSPIMPVYCRITTAHHRGQ